MTAAAIPESVRALFHAALPGWFRRHRRALPWRTRRTPYRVWISELMLQQTRVDQALPYYRRFLRRFPSLRSLARAPLQDVLKAWEGLGYYARARHAHRAARFLVAHRAGRFPRTLSGLAGLPGVGRYTAAAVGSLAMGLQAAAVDGNVARVLSRFFASRRVARSPAGRRWLERRAGQVIQPGRAGESNEALMELGATVCLPQAPRCSVCPLRPGCRAAREGDPRRYPARRRRRRVPHKVVGAGIVADARGRVLIAQRRETSMLGGLWEFPGGTRERGETMPACIRRELLEELGIRTRVGGRLLVVRHAYSHFTIALHAHWARIVRGRPRPLHCADFAWVTVKGLRKYPFSAADLRIVRALEDRRGGWPVRLPGLPSPWPRGGRRSSSSSRPCTSGSP
jgi:A/G-specific adenine glycosylase